MMSLLLILSPLMIVFVLGICYSSDDENDVTIDKDYVERKTLGSKFYKK